MDLPQTMLPVYFSRHQDESMTTEDFDNSVSMNETNLRENLNVLYNKVCELIENNGGNK